MICEKDYEQITEVFVQNELNQILSQEIPNLSEQETYKLILNCIDLTTLEGNDTNEKVAALCRKAYGFSEQNPALPNVAAVCVYSVFASLVKKNLMGKNIKTVCVAGAFPSGQSPISVKLQEIQYAIDQGSEEIDMVISRGSLLEGNYNKVYDEIASIKEYCKNVCLKVILETGELQSLKNIAIASDLAIWAGADFIKTSTGKIPVSATKEAALVMLHQIKNHYQKTGKRIGFKASGGISEPEQAKMYLQLTQATLGDEYLNNSYFRIGASRLANAVFEQLKHICDC